MVQILPSQPSVFGRLGQGLAKGLSETVPQEIERARLSKGLQSLENQKGLTPFQQFSRLSAIPGITPQMIQSGTELLRQQGISEGLKKGSTPQQGQNQENPFKNFTGKQQPQGQNPSIATTAPVKATIENYIPKTLDQLNQRAGELHTENPQLYPTPQDAQRAAQQEDTQNQAINVAQQQQRKGQQDVEATVERDVAEQIDKYGANLPGNVSEDLVNEARESVRTGKLTEKEAAIQAGKKADQISRDYANLDSIGNWGILTKSPESTRNNLKSLQKKFKARNDLENFADSMVGKNGLSNGKAYLLAYPVSDDKQANNLFSKLPIVRLDKSQNPTEETRKINDKLAKHLGNNNSPLAFAEELNVRGYNPDEFLNYVRQNSDKLNLTQRQMRELDKPRNWFSTLSDLWLFNAAGLEKLIEKE